MKRLFTISPAGVSGCFATGLVNGSFWGMGAVYAQKSGMLTQEISVFMAIVVLGGILTQWPLGKLSDRIDRRLVIIAIAFSIMGASIALSLAGNVAIELRLLAGGLFGMAAFPLYAISIAHVNDKVRASDFVPASSTLLVIYGIGAVMGPVSGSVAMAQYGPGGLFYYTAIVALLLGFFATHRLLTGKKVSRSDKEDFVSVPKTSQIAANMAAAISEEKNADD